MAKNILFIGEHDKTDLLFYLGKALSIQHKVLLVDATSSHRYEYVYPKIEGTQDIVQHASIDIIEDITGHDELEKILSQNELRDEYDYLLVDIDRRDALSKWPDVDQYFLVTSYENSCVQRNKSLLESFFEGKLKSELLPVHRIIYEVSGTFNEEYLNELYDIFPIDWKEDFFYYPEENDMKIRIRNQVSSMIQVKGLTKEYTKMLKQVIALILEQDIKSINSLWKEVERR